MVIHFFGEIRIIVSEYKESEGIRGNPKFQEIQKNCVIVSNFIVV